MNSKKLLAAIVFTALALPGSALAGTVTYKDCSATAKSEIPKALAWLTGNISKVDAKMGKNGLMDWPGDSRSKWKAKLGKDLHFVCKDEKNKCQRVSGDGMVLYGQVVPVFAQKTIQLCTNHFSRGLEDYVSTIAHEVGHLVRLNAHRTSCTKKCEKPRFSQSVGLAARHAYKNTSYSASTCKSGC